ncbi:MAG: hypothetical protein R2745_20020 [Vicinamibacterales bacterium]
MPYLRLTADRRGYENTFLLHVPAPGQPPRVLYWYRTAPGLRIGRPALDESAMRSLEEQYPDIDFDWTYILDVGSMTPVEVEAPLPPRRRRPRPAEADADADANVAPDTSRSEEPARELTATDAARPTQALVVESPSADGPSTARAPGPDLLGQLLGRGIAASLRGRHDELRARIDASAAPADIVAGWRQRLEALDPDCWTTPEAVLAGMQSVDRDLDALTDALDAADS